MPGRNPVCPSPSFSPHHALTQVEKTVILAAFNQTRAGVPWGDGLAQLEWDSSLEALAQTWAATCTPDPSGSGLLAHNPNRGARYPTSVGENLSGWAVPPSPNPAVNMANTVTMVNLWMEGGAKYDYATNRCDGQLYSIRNKWKSCGHYTQVVSAATTKVGCGRSFCQNLAHRSTIVCDFTSAGNTYDPSTGMLKRP